MELHGAYRADMQPDAKSKDKRLHSEAEIYRDGRFVYFNTDINHCSVSWLMRDLREAERDILKDVKAAKKAIDKAADEKEYKLANIHCDPEPIVLTLTTYGGGVHAAFAVVDLIRTLKVPVHTVIHGYVASAGTLISLAGEKRLMGKHAMAMLHEVRSWNWGKYSDLRDGFENVQKTMDQIVDYYTERTKITREALAEILARDRDWDPQSCLDQGVIDEIV